MKTDNIAQLLRQLLGVKFLLQDRILLESFEQVNK